MVEVYVGTSYHQVFCVPLNIKSPIAKFGDKKKCPVTAIHLPSSYTPNIISYSDPLQIF